MKAALLTLVGLLTLVPSPGTPGQGQGGASTANSEIRNPKSETSTPRFEYLDVFIDPHGKPLAAYQFELTVDPGSGTIVGVEGGDHAAYKPAPYYDPAALSQNRIIVAAFNTGADLPSERTRVARLHMRFTSDTTPSVKLQSSADSNGNPIAADAAIERGS
ncbi:MAG: hypothetical protein ACREJC_13060 [Tepidisphaeraceae bacterium]